MQYKIPIQIENEDTIVLGLSLRQLIIMMVFGGIAYSAFQFIQPKIGGTAALVFAIPIGTLGVVIALIRVAEMTFLPFVLNAIRLSLNGQSRPWSQGTDGFNEFLDIGYISMSSETNIATTETKSFQEMTRQGDFSEKLKNL